MLSLDRGSQMKDHLGEKHTEIGQRNRHFCRGYHLNYVVGFLLSISGLRIPVFALVHAGDMIAHYVSPDFFKERFNKGESKWWMFRHGTSVLSYMLFVECLCVVPPILFLQMYKAAFEKFKHDVQPEMFLLLAIGLSNISIAKGVADGARRRRGRWVVGSFRRHELGSVRRRCGAQRRHRAARQR